MQFHRLGFWDEIVEAEFLIERVTVFCGGEFDIVEIEFDCILNQKLHEFFCMSLLSEAGICIDIEDKTCAAIDKRWARRFFCNKKQCNRVDSVVFICGNICMDVLVQVLLEILPELWYKVIDMVLCESLVVFVQIGNPFFDNLWNIGVHCMLISHFSSSFLLSSIPFIVKEAAFIDNGP